MTTPYCTLTHAFVSPIVLSHVWTANVAMLMALTSFATLNSNMIERQLIYVRQIFVLFFSIFWASINPYNTYKVIARIMRYRERLRYSTTVLGASQHNWVKPKTSKCSIGSKNTDQSAEQGPIIILTSILCNKYINGKRE